MTGLRRAIYRWAELLTRYAKPALRTYDGEEEGGLKVGPKT